MSTPDHDHDHQHASGEHHHPHEERGPERYYAARTKALESLFRENGLIGTDTVDRVIHFFDHEMGPFNGARVVAKAWTDEAFRARLLADANQAIKELGLREGIEGENLKVVENTPSTHNVVCCTLCSCWPWPLLGLPPYWFKDPVFRARVVREPRAVLKDFGVELDSSKKVAIWDSSAQVRFFVIPQRPEGTDHYSQPPSGLPQLCCEPA